VEFKNNKADLSEAAERVTLATYPRILVVTPARNERNNLPKLIESLRSQTVNLISLFVIADDNSSDGTNEYLLELDLPFKTSSIQVKSSGRIISGGAYFSWWEGVNYGQSNGDEFDFIMKLDADVSLAKNYFEVLLPELRKGVDLIGGVIEGKGREQKIYVPGPVKLYSNRALSLVRSLPISTGFDVMDEVLCRQQGLVTKVCKNAKFSLNRPIGFSQGKLHGRYRNGLVCKWTGYSVTYFLLHLIRYIFRRPYLLGSLWMLAGFVFSSTGPFPKELRIQHRDMQRSRLRSIYKHPISAIKELYF